MPARLRHGAARPVSKYDLARTKRSSKKAFRIKSRQPGHRVAEYAAGQGVREFHKAFRQPVDLIHRKPHTTAQDRTGELGLAGLDFGEVEYDDDQRIADRSERDHFIDPRC